MQPAQQKIKLAIADDHKLFRRGIISLIETHRNDQYDILLEAINGEDLMTRLDKDDLPNIVIMDIDMPKADGFQTVAWLSEHYPGIKTLVVSHIDREEAIIRMLKLGVKGYLSKDVEPDELHSALQEIYRKGFYYTDFITGKLIHSLQNADKKGGGETAGAFNHEAQNQMNERERDFLQRCCSELTYEHIANEMHLSPKTIDGYRNSLFEKFGVSNRIGLVLFAIRNGLVKI
jgi:two-component system, NarL family, invasion response regulator UvrY